MYFEIFEEFKDVLSFIGCETIKDWIILKGARWN